MEFLDLIKEAAPRQLSLVDVELYCEASEPPMTQRLETCALKLARGYASGSISYEAGDNLVNILFEFAAEHVEISNLPILSNAIFIILMLPLFQIINLPQ